MNITLQLKLIEHVNNVITIVNPSLFLMFTLALLSRSLTIHFF